MYRGSPLRSTVVNTNVITVNACFGSFIRENGKKSRTKCSLCKFLARSLQEVSHEMLVFEVSCMKFGGSLARNARFGSFLCESWRKSRTKCSFLKCLAWNLEEVSHEVLGCARFIYFLIWFYFFVDLFLFFLIPLLFFFDSILFFFWSFSRGHMGHTEIYRINIINWIESTRKKLQSNSILGGGFKDFLLLTCGEMI